MRIESRYALFLILAGLLSGCLHAYQPGIERVPQMSLADARVIVRTYANGKPSGTQGKQPFTDRVEITRTGLRFLYVDGRSVMCRFDHVTPRAGSFDPTTWYYVVMVGCVGIHKPYGVTVELANAAEVDRYADAVYLLKQDYLARQAPEPPQQQAAFDIVVTQYRATKPSPALPESAVRSKAQAEFAVQQKRFDDAVDLYGEALKAAPWWPQGYYNRGLLLGELEAYTEAIRDLQKYLKLEPNAPNAQAVQTKIYQWESVAPKPAAAR